MGKCVSQQKEQTSVTHQTGKPEEYREEPETYTNSDAYFIDQTVALITHEIYDISVNVSETLLLTHVFYAESIDLLTAIRDRFFITYERYKFTTYQRESDTRKTNRTNRNTIPKHHHHVPSHEKIPSADSFSMSHPLDPPVSDETEHKNRYKPLHRMHLDATDIEYIPIETHVLDFKDWIPQVKMVIQRKCLDLLLQWIQCYWVQDFNQNEAMIQLLTQFIQEIKTSRDQFQDLMQNTDNKHKKRRKRDKPQQQQHDHHRIYAAFLIPYILKLDNVIATQQSWYKPIVEKLRNRQALQQKLHNEQIQKSKKHKSNRLNGKTIEHHRATNSVSAFSDTIFSDLCVDDEGLETCTYPVDETTDSEEDKGDRMSNMLAFISMKNKQNADEYAKQLTLLDWELFIVINLRICLYKIVAKQRTDEWLALKLFIDRFQQTHRYVIVSIVGSAPDLRARIEMIEFFILVADHLLSINNLYSFMAVMTALDSVSIQKLRIAWDLVDKGLKEKYMNRLSPLCSANNNYKALRDYTLRMEAPAIPFLALLLKDLTFTNDGHKDRLSADLDGHINFNKYMLLFRILSDNIDRFQSKTYCQRMMHSKQFESEDINGLVQQLAVYEIEEEDKDEDKREVNYIDIIPDMELQQNILEDLNVYIVLGRDVIRQMTTEANRTDSLKRGQYILEYTDRKMNENEDKIKNQKQSTISNVIRMLFTSYQSTNALNTLAE